MNKIIAVDLDEVLAETMRALLIKHDGKIANKKITWNEIVSYDLWKIPKLSISKKRAIMIFFWFLIWAWFWNKLEAVVWAKSKLEELKSKWYKLHVVTARHFLFRFTTWVWLYGHYKHVFSSIEFANFFSRFSTKKSVICKKLWASIIIEDNLKNAIECAEADIRVYLLDKPWNQDYNKKIHGWIIKVKSWCEIKI